MKDMTCGTTLDVLLGLISYTDTKAKCRDLPKFTCKGTFAAGVYQSLYVDCRKKCGQSVMLVFLTQLCANLDDIHTKPCFS